LKRTCRLVYDTHEYFTEVPELQGRFIVKTLWEQIEKWIFPKLDTIYTVNQTIAAIYREKYLKKVLVVRNVSPKWRPEKRKTREELGLPTDKFILILQGAGINVDRGAEEAVEAVRELRNVLLLILGDGDSVPLLKSYVASNCLSDKVMFLPKMPYLEMMQYTACADVGLTLDKPSNLNYRFSLPNKLFDYLNAGIPVICTDLPEVAKIVQTYNVGVILNDFSITALQNQIRLLQHDQEKTKRFKSNCALAAEQECWENETDTLQFIYPPID
jgi:glycosyltransferase involved in cell wall biosynthesis